MVLGHMAIILFPVLCKCRNKIKKSKDNKNQMQRRLNNEIIKKIKLFDFLLIFDLKVQPKQEIELLTIFEHNDEFPQISVSSTLTLVEVGCMYTISINQRNQKNQNL